MENKINNLLIFFILISTSDGCGEEYFNEKMIRYVGTTNLCNGEKLTLKIFREYDFILFLNSIDFSKVSNDNKIFEYKINNKIVYRINGIHQNLVNFILEKIDTVDSSNNYRLRDFKLNYLLSKSKSSNTNL